MCLSPWSSLRLIVPTGQRSPCTIYMWSLGVSTHLSHHIDTRETGGENNKRIDLIVTFHVLGTAIAPPAEHRPLDPNLMIRLDERTP